MKFILFKTILFFSCGTLFSDSFKDCWLSMQILYQQLNQHPKAEQFDHNLVHPTWNSLRKPLASLITGPACPSFLFHDIIQKTMLRQGFGATQRYEQNFLQYCISKETQEKIQLFSETNIGNLNRECAVFNCASNTLGQLFYFSKICELIKPKNITKMVEFGGGYGALARIAKTLIPDITYIIIDTPELCAIAYLYLSLALPDVKIKAHADIPLVLEENVIHIIPIYFISELDIQAVDVFVSAFGISESPQYTQKMITEKFFFNADFCYIAGLANSKEWPHHKYLLDAIRIIYQYYFCQPTHVTDEKVFCYEIFGKKG